MGAGGSGGNAGGSAGGNDTGGNDTGGNDTGGSGGGQAGAGGDGGDAGGAGAGGQPLVDYQVFIQGDFVADGDDQVGFHGYPGAVTTTLPQVFDGFEAAALSPDGTKIVVVYEPTTNNKHVVELFPADGVGASTVLFEVPNHLSVLGRADFSPDGDWVAFLYREHSNWWELWVVPTAGGTAKRVSFDAPDVNHEVQGWRWARGASLTETWLALWGENGAANTVDVWTVDVEAAIPAPIRITDAVDSDEDVRTSGAPDWDASGRIYWVHDYLTDDQFQLFRADADGTNVEEVPGTALTNEAGPADVSTFALSHDGTQIAFAADAPVRMLDQVRVMQVDSGAPQVVSAVQTALLGFEGSKNGAYRMVWSPDGAHIAVLGDWYFNGSYPEIGGAAVYLIPGMPPAGGFRLLPNASADDFYYVKLAFSADSQRLIVA